jgi:hypothetical protein
VAAHAFIAAVATVALASAASTRFGALQFRVAARGSRTDWKAVFAQVAFGVVSAQVAVGTLLRHQLTGLTSHLAVGGVAVLALLTPAVAILQDPSAPEDQRRAARLAITAVLVQVGLGATVLLMILIGAPSVTAWLLATIAHVTVGTLTLLASARFALVMTASAEATSAGGR